MHWKNIRSSSEGTDSSSQIQETEQKREKKHKNKRDSQKKFGERRWKFYHEIAASSELVYNTTKKQRSADRTQTD
jgi:hypothetical protein